jgi:hypothetical protein
MLTSVMQPSRLAPGFDILVDSVSRQLIAMPKDGVRQRKQGGDGASGDDWDSAKVDEGIRPWYEKPGRV